MLDKFPKLQYNKKRKGKAFNGYAKSRVYKIAPTLAGGGYLTLCVSINEKIQIKIKILMIFFNMITTSFLDL